MKFIKFSIIALVLIASAQFAKAQVRVGVHIGYHEPYRRVVYAPAPVYYERPVYYNAPVYYRPGYRRAFYGRGYNRPVFHGYRGREFDRGFRGRGHAYGRRW